MGQSYTWRQSIQMPGGTVIYLAAVHIDRCPVGQLYTWLQSIQTDARWDSYIPGGSPYRQMPGRTKSRSVAKPRRMAAEFAACSLTPLFLHDQRQHQSFTTSDQTLAKGTVVWLTGNNTVFALM